MTLTDMVGVTYKRYQRTKDELAEIHRKLATHRKTLQGKLVNDTLRMAGTFMLEKLS